jgi:hypothetical protein
MVGNAEREKVLERLREICLGLPEASERRSHGAPTFFVRGKRSFVTVLTDHHGDGRFAIWCAAPPGVQGSLTENDPEKFFVPPYVRTPRVARRPARPRDRLGRARRDRRGRVRRGRAGRARAGGAGF